MLVYRDNEYTCDAGTALTAVMAAAEAAARRPGRDTAVDLLIDQLFPDSDGTNHLERCLRGASLAAGHAVIAGCERHSTAAHAANVLHQLATLRTESLPRQLVMRLSEGYAYYGLHPYVYATSARRFADEYSPMQCVCIGTRSIGTSLSAVVAAALARRGVGIDLYSVRPHGHPFERRLSMRDDLTACLRNAPAGSFYLVIDEGPGLSGSSFACVANALVALGVPASQVILFPSWNADGSTFRSDAARRTWQRHRRYAVVQQNRAGGVDWSGGAWRRHVLGPDEAAWPAVQPQHEVEKTWRPEEDTVVRFAGLGRYGRAKLARAEALAAEGLGAAPCGLDDGYLSLTFVPGSVCRRTSLELCDAIAAHLAFLVQHFPAHRSPSIDQLELMIETNLAEGIAGHHALHGLDEGRAALDAAPAAEIDGRMMPHEWIHTDDGRFVKVDALDHHADHFFPGIQDAGWDLAAAAFEFGMDVGCRERLVARYAALSGDRDVTRRLPFFDVAYPAFRLGYATLASQSVSDPDERARFERVIERCRQRLMFPSAP